MCNCGENDKCLCCPYGGYHAIPSVMSGFAFFFTFVASVSCNLFDIVAQEDPKIFGNFNASQIQFGVGLWGVENITTEFVDDQNQNTCVESPYEADTAIKFGRFCSTVSVTLSLMVFVFILVPSCRIVHTKFAYWKTLAASCYVTAIVTILMLVGMASKICQEAVECSMGESGGTAIFASVGWVFAGTACLFVKPRPRTEQQQQRQQELATNPSTQQPQETAPPTMDDLEDVPLPTIT